MAQKAIFDDEAEIQLYASKNGSKQKHLELTFKNKNKIQFVCQEITILLPKLHF